MDLSQTACMFCIIAMYRSVLGLIIYILARLPITRVIVRQGTDGRGSNLTISGEKITQAPSLVTFKLRHYSKTSLMAGGR